MGSGESACVMNVAEWYQIDLCVSGIFLVRVCVIIFQQEFSDLISVCSFWKFYIMDGVRTT